MEQLTGIKTKERVKEHGEVFTPDSIVNDMLDLTDEAMQKDGVSIKETPRQYIAKTYLEPACGNGNFLIRILDRKLDAVRQLPKEEQNFALVMAVSTIYGIDIQSDNVAESKTRMLELIKKGKIEVLELQNKEKKPFSGEGFELSPELEAVIRFILDRNIQHGDMLKGVKWENNGFDRETNDELIITEFRFDESDKTVVMETCTLNSMQDNQLSIPLNTTEKMNYMELKNLGTKLEEDEANDNEDVDF